MVKKASREHIHHKDTGRKRNAKRKQNQTRYSERRVDCNSDATRKKKQEIQSTSYEVKNAKRFIASRRIVPRRFGHHNLIPERVPPPHPRPPLCLSQHGCRRRTLVLSAALPPFSPFPPSRLLGRAVSRLQLLGPRPPVLLARKAPFSSLSV